MSLPIIPVARPRLPARQAIMDYLRRIDESRVYTNFGPLASLLAERLAGHFALPADCVALMANGTLALTVALEEIRLDHPLCLMPSWTFAATPHAAVSAGLTPYFLDVGADGVLTPAIVRAALPHLPAPAAAVVAVAPFGLPVELSAWDEFTAETGIPVVLDAAAAFDTLRPSTTPAVVSLHASKPISAGEGGFIVARQPDLIQRCLRHSNFGFSHTREAAARATNAKLSEYHAAVGLASLEEWPRRREEWMEVGRRYRRLLAPHAGLTLQHGFGESWIGSVCVVETGPLPSEILEASLRAAGIDTRRWWSWGCHRQPAFSQCPHGDLTMTDTLARKSLGLPFLPDLEPDAQAAVVEIAAATVAQWSSVAAC